jgi:(2R)-3-sulfolactate dehydrogenase (NADP+)
VEALVTAMLADEGVRLPGARRTALAARAATEGLGLPDALLKRLHELAGN